MRLFAALAVLFLLSIFPSPARAGSEPIVAPAPEWVEPVAIGAADPNLSDRPVQTLLASSQSFYAADHIDHFIDLAFVIQNAQGLQGLGNITIPWQPDQTDLIVHKVQIVRAGRVIDLLAGGQHFTVLRRENNLESAMLDGTLTAVMQAEGLAVGDILNISWTMRRHGGALPLRGENFFSLTTQPVRHLSIRQIWSRDIPIQWRGTGAFEAARASPSRYGTELRLDLADANGPQLPDAIPVRLSMPSTLQISQYRDWAEISAELASHFAQASQIAPNSPLHAEIERIAAATTSPRERTMAALRLVQDQVRYFALVMGDGNYLPATADQTWARRYADCKGKTSLLLALLSGLGIEAEPVLVNTAIGDTLEDRLPMLALFNHVIVRARIDGRSYWLDGTRTGDRSLDDLATSTLGWGLPVRTTGAALERLPFGPPSRPLNEGNVVYDGSHGLGGPIPMRTELVFRGDDATRMRQAVSRAGRDEFLRVMRENMVNHRDDDDASTTISSVDLHDDPDGGALTIIITGRVTLNWNPIPGLPPARSARRFRFDNGTFNDRLQVERPEGPFHDAPVALGVPYYTANTETVILPPDTRGVSIDGGNFRRTVGADEFVRQVSMADGRVTIRSELRRINREVSAASIETNNRQIDEIMGNYVYLKVPQSMTRAPSRTASQ